ncbi:MAG: phage tail assembly protein [Myxococcales bacterium]|nr:phage tail assembly protein [Myxococcales bacterium]
MATERIKTEFAFRLPRGYVDAEGNVHRDGVMRLATARDEIIPLQDYRVQNNRAYLVIVLLSRVISKLGKLDIITIEVVENLFSTDLAYLQEFYRKINEEAGAPKHHIACTACGHELDVDMVSGLVLGAGSAEGGSGQSGPG